MKAASLSKVLRRVDDWKLKLIDLSKRNKLINFTPSKSSTVTFESPSINEVFNRLVIKDTYWNIYDPPEDRRGVKPRKTQLVPMETEPSQLRRVLRYQARKATTEFRERGIRILYISYGVLHWIDKTTNQELTSPIVLTPVELTRKSTRDPYRIEVPAVEDEAILNPALRLKLRYDHQIELPALPDFDNVSIESYLKHVEQSLEGTNWIVEHQINMGLFSFYKLVMYQDLDENAEKIAEHPIISSLANITPPPIVKGRLPNENDLDKVLDPQKVYQVLDADSSQQLCIEYALRGQSFVMHGPPGTGKSQTIANMISEFMAAGKSILFVSEKMAALEVVYNRLKAQGLDDFCLELHSHKANKREVVAELKRSLDEHIRLRKGMTFEELERLKTRRDQLNTYVNSLHTNRKPIELSSFDLFGRISRLEEYPFIPSGYSAFNKLNQNKLFELDEQIRRISNTWAVVEDADDFPWSGCIEESFTPNTRSKWISKLDSTLEIIRDLTFESRRYATDLGLKPPNNFEDYERLQRLCTLIRTTPRPPIKWLKNIDLTELKPLAEGYMGEWAGYWKNRLDLESHYDTRFLTLSPGYAERVKVEWEKLKKLLKPTSKDGEGFLANMRTLDNFLRELPGLVNIWKKYAEEAQNLLGLKGEVKTIERAYQISDLVKLLATSDRPERSWLDDYRLQEVKATIILMKEDREKYVDLSSKLENYTEEILTLDHDRLINWFEGSGQSFFKIFMPSHYSNKGIIEKVSKTDKTPETVVEDLKTAKDLVTHKAKMVKMSESTRKRFASFYFDDTLDFEAADRAIKIAEKALKLSGRSRIPKILRDNLVIGTKPSNEILNLGNQLDKSISKWVKDSRRIRSFIPLNKLPNTKKSMQKSSFNDLTEWAKQSRNQLDNLLKTSSEALATRKDDYAPTFNAFILNIKKSEGLQAFEDYVTGQADELRKLFDGLYNGLMTDWKTMLNAIDWTQRLLRTLPEGVPDALKNTVSHGGSRLPEDPKIRERLERFYSHLNDINANFEVPIWPNPKTVDLASVENRVTILRSRIDALQTWVDYNRLDTEIRNVGLGSFLDQLVKRRCKRQDILSIFKKAIYQGLLDWFFNEDPSLKAFRSKDHEQLISDFQKLDRKFISLNSQRVIDIANEKKPTGVFVQAPDSEITVLMREAAKKRRHMPLRELFERIPNLIMRLKPCLMMSPISVSQFLKPNGIHFDLIVFDEASQIYTEDAVGAIYRGDQLVVAGDPKQLPPTPFFQYTVDEDFDWDTEYEFDVFDSVLDECMSIGLPVKMLRWHYRSRHDSLISFSNDRFYDGQLVLFPSSRMGVDDLGLSFVYVKNGVYDRGKSRNNIREAEVVADLVFDHFTRYPDKTLGVVTFSISQMNAVQDVIESRLREHSEFEQYFKEDRLNGFFVKNLENVQGDERDVIIFSVGYGYDQNGKITMNFGPLNKSGGERRLNVAVTRARDKVVLVSSIKHDDIKLTSTQALGVHSLHHYLRYAEHRPQNLAEDGLDSGFSSEIEADIAEEVERMGYRVVPSIGSSSFRVDLGVLDPNNPGRFMMGIMCDGDTYRDANTARDRDRLRFQVLKNLGWNIHRIWSPDWVQRRGTEIRKLKKSLEKSLEQPVNQVPPIPQASPKLIEEKTEKQVQKVQVEELKSNDLPDVEPYRFSNPRPRYLFSRYSSEHRERYLKQYHNEVRRLLPGVVKFEAPIHLEQAYRRLNKAFRLARATKPFKDAYEEEVKNLSTKGFIKLKEKFLWPPKEEEIRVRVPVEGVRESFRPIEHIASMEVEKAMLIVAEYSFQGIGLESLLIETAKLLGFRRIGPNIEEVINKAYRNLIRRKQLDDKDGQVFPRKK